jgi:hypothetical protein
MSFRAGDRFLNARNGTTAELVAAGKVRAVRWGTRTKVLRSELERIAAEGLAPDGVRPRPHRRRPTTTGIGAAILAIDIDRKGPTP